MPRLNGKVPSYRLHRVSGQAIVTLNGRDHYLGPHGTETSKREYDRLVAEWLANGRQAPQVACQAPALSINYLVRDFWNHAKTYYRRPDGSPTSELHTFKQVLRVLRRLYEDKPVTDFGPLTLKALREHLVAKNWSRTYINAQVSRIKSMFRWGVENERVPASVHQALLAVKGLTQGRCEAKENDRVQPAPEHLIAAIQPYVSPQVWTLVQLQLLTGARPSELLKLRRLDLKVDGELWVVEPEQHKTAHHGFAKKIYFGPQAQALLTPFLSDRPVDNHLFSPAEAEADRLAKLHKARRTPMSCGNRPGSNRVAEPTRKPQDFYTVDSYRRAIERGCDQAFPLPAELRRVSLGKGRRLENPVEWKARLGMEKVAVAKAWRKTHRFHPYQLRHNAATHLRREFGIEAARTILGHHSLAITEVYAEMDFEKARQVVRKVG